MPKNPYEAYGVNQPSMAGGEPQTADVGAGAGSVSQPSGGSQSYGGGLGGMASSASVGQYPGTGPAGKPSSPMPGTVGPASGTARGPASYRPPRPPRQSQARQPMSGSQGAQRMMGISDLPTQTPRNLPRAPSLSSLPPSIRNPPRPGEGFGSGMPSTAEVDRWRQSTPAAQRQAAKDALAQKRNDDRQRQAEIRNARAPKSDLPRSDDFNSPENQRRRLEGVGYGTGNRAPSDLPGSDVATDYQRNRRQGDVNALRQLEQEQGLPPGSKGTQTAADAINRIGNQPPVSDRPPADPNARAPGGMSAGPGSPGGPFNQSPPWPPQEPPDYPEPTGPARVDPSGEAPPPHVSGIGSPWSNTPEGSALEEGLARADEAHRQAGGKWLEATGNDLEGSMTPVRPTNEPPDLLSGAGKSKLSPGEMKDEVERIANLTPEQFQDENYQKQQGSDFPQMDAPQDIMGGYGNDAIEGSHGNDGPGNDIIFGDGGQQYGQPQQAGGLQIADVSVSLPPMADGAFGLQVGETGQGQAAEGIDIGEGGETTLATDPSLRPGKPQDLGTADPTKPAGGQDLGTADLSKPSGQVSDYSTQPQEGGDLVGGGGTDEIPGSGPRDIIFGEDEPPNDIIFGEGDQPTAGGEIVGPQRPVSDADYPNRPPGAGLGGVFGAPRPEQPGDYEEQIGMIRDGQFYPGGFANGWEDADAGNNMSHIERRRAASPPGFGVGWDQENFERGYSAAKELFGKTGELAGRALLGPSTDLATGRTSTDASGRIGRAVGESTVSPFFNITRLPNQSPTNQGGGGALGQLASLGSSAISWPSRTGESIGRAIGGDTGASIGGWLAPLSRLARMAGVEPDPRYAGDTAQIDAAFDIASMADPAMLPGRRGLSSLDDAARAVSKLDDIPTVTPARGIADDLPFAKLDQGGTPHHVTPDRPPSLPPADMTPTTPPKVPDTPSPGTYDLGPPTRGDTPPPISAELPPSSGGMVTVPAEDLRELGRATGRSAQAEDLIARGGGGRQVDVPSDLLRTFNEDARDVAKLPGPPAERPPIYGLAPDSASKPSGPRDLGPGIGMIGEGREPIGFRPDYGQIPPARDLPPLPLSDVPPRGPGSFGLGRDWEPRIPLAGDNGLPRGLPAQNGVPKGLESILGDQPRAPARPPAAANISGAEANAQRLAQLRDQYRAALTTDPQRAAQLRNQMDRLEGGAQGFASPAQLMQQRFNAANAARLAAGEKLGDARQAAARIPAGSENAVARADTVNPARRNYAVAAAQSNAEARRLANARGEPIPPLNPYEAGYGKVYDPWLGEQRPILPGERTNAPSPTQARAGGGRSVPMGEDMGRMPSAGRTTDDITGGGGGPPNKPPKKPSGGGAASDAVEPIQYDRRPYNPLKLPIVKDIGNIMQSSQGVVSPLVNAPGFGSAMNAAFTANAMNQLYKRAREYKQAWRQSGLGGLWTEATTPRLYTPTANMSDSLHQLQYGRPSSFLGSNTQDAFTAANYVYSLYGLRNFYNKYFGGQQAVNEQGQRNREAAIENNEWSNSIKRGLNNFGFNFPMTGAPEYPQKTPEQRKAEQAKIDELNRYNNERGLPPVRSTKPETDEQALKRIRKEQAKGR